MAGKNGASRQDQTDALRARIKKAVEEADFAFWNKIAKSFPEATGGDFPPDATFAWDMARDEAVFSWLYWNHPKSGLVEKIRKEGPL